MSDSCDLLQYDMGRESQLHSFSSLGGRTVLHLSLFYVPSDSV